MSAIVDGLLFGWNKNLDYGQRLISDLDPSQMTLQPVTTGAPVNHPAWIFSHLNVYLPVIENVILGNEFEDPKQHPFGMLSQPESDASIYPSKDELLAAFSRGHEQVAQALAQEGAAALERPVLLERWKEIMPVAGVCVPYLMLIHENMHLGQLSAWRRVLGMPRV